MIACSSVRDCFGLPTKYLILSLLLTQGCSPAYREDLDYSYEVVQTWPVEELDSNQIVQFESVFWEADDTVSLRKMIVDDAIVTNREVLEIGTGTGIIAILCIRNNAKRVVATDINKVAVANARYNAAMLDAEDNLEIRHVDANNPGAYSVIASDEKFDLILSNPPWEDGLIKKPLDHAFYDPDFRLQDSILDGLSAHLNPGGRALLVYGNKLAIERLKAGVKKRGLRLKFLDDRTLESLEENFLPGMVIEIRLASKNSVGQLVGDQNENNQMHVKEESDPKTNQ